MKFSEQQTQALGFIAKLREAIRRACPPGAEVDIVISFPERPEWNVKIGMLSISKFKEVLESLSEAATCVVAVEKDSEGVPQTTIKDLQ